MQQVESVYQRPIFHPVDRQTNIPPALIQSTRYSAHKNHLLVLRSFAIDAYNTPQYVNAGIKCGDLICLSDFALINTNGSIFMSALACLWVD
jgi:hypothetical protein